MKNKAHLRLIEKGEEAPRQHTGRKTVPLPALDAVRGAKDTEEAFYLLMNWSQSKTALNTPAYEVEQQLQQGGFELLRRMLEDNFRLRGLGDVGEAVIIDTEDKEVVLANKREHRREYESIFGTIALERLGYGAPSYDSVHPLDEELNLPARRYSYLVQKRGAKLCGRGPYDEVLEELGESTAAHVPKRQLEQISRESAEDFEAFYQQRCTQLPAPEQTGSILVAGVDCKGIPKRKTEEEKAETEPIRLSKGQKRKKKKMATVASVHTTEPHIRSAEQVVEQLMDPDVPKRSEGKPKAEYRRLWASVLKSKDEVIEQAAEEMKRRDPSGEKTAVCLTDGERALHLRALKYLKSVFPSLILILDIIHVLEYLWKAAYVFRAEGSEEARLWVRQRLMWILQGKVSQVVAGIRQSATKQRISRKKREVVDTVCNYMLKNKDRMCYNEYLAQGLPIASGSVEGACGHLVKDRMERTGALWKVQDKGADAILKIRALDKSGDWEEYWDFHMKQEHNRQYHYKKTNDSEYVRPWRVAA
jgi:hypothetical protein